MKNKLHNWLWGLMLCFCVLLSGTTVAAEETREAYYQMWSYQLWDSNDTNWTDGVTVHAGETLKLCVMGESYTGGPVEQVDFDNGGTLYYDWAITTGTYTYDEETGINLNVEWDSLKYRDEHVSVWVPTVANCNYVYVKGLKATDADDNLYLTLYRRFYPDGEPRAVAFVPLTVIPAESGVTYTDYGEEEPTDFYETKEELFAALRQVMMNREKGVNTFYTTVEIIEPFCRPEYLPDNYMFNHYYLYDFYSDQGQIAPTEGDYLQQCFYGVFGTSEQVNTCYRGELLVSVEMDTEGCVYVTTVEQEREFEAKLAALFADGGELSGIRNLSDYDKIIAIREYINSHVTYQGSYDALKHTAYSALCQGEATCQGASLLYYRMLREVGILNRILMGVDAGAHTYNLILLDGKYYYSDVMTSDVLRGTDNFSPAQLQEHYLTDEFRSGVLSKLSATDYVVTNGPEPTVTPAPTETPDQTTSATIYGGVDYAAVYDVSYYAENNSDVVVVLGNNAELLLKHFVECGMAEGRQGSAEFNLDAYKENNSDVAAAFGSDNKSYYMHYITCGKAEGRIAVNTGSTGGTSGGNTSGGSTNGNAVYNGVDYSAVYDKDFYASANPDVAGAFNGNAEQMLKHFVECGMSEGRQGSADFDLNIYKANNGDVAAAFGTDNKSYYMHYINCGKAEGRVASNTGNAGGNTGDSSGGGSTGGSAVYNGVDYSAVYDKDFYGSANPDVAGAFNGNAEQMLKHFVECGMSEGRQASAEFDLNVYRSQNGDVAAAFGNDNASYYMHYINCGKDEGRVASNTGNAGDDTGNTGGTSGGENLDYSLVFNAEFYANTYGDIKAAFGSDADAMLNHFIQCGMSEGRQGNADFNVQVYRAKYGDLSSAYGNELAEYYKHYIKYGYAEGRTGK